MWTECRVNVRENQRVINKALYLVLAVNLEGQKELLGMWIAQTEGAKFWLSVLDLPAEPWGERYLHCVCGWTQRSTRSDRDGLSTDTGTIVHGAFDAQLGSATSLIST
jgi:hypothetical protein